MSETTRPIRICSVIALLGGLVAIACMAITYAPNEYTITDISFYMLVSVLFFALAGAFTRNNQWNAKMVIVMTFVTLAVVIVAAMYGSFDYAVAITIGVFGVLLLVMSVFPSVKGWLGNKDL